MSQRGLYNRQDCEDFLRGCLWMGTGGGGGLRWGRRVVALCREMGVPGY